jgi:hypothetical protein
MIAFLSFLFRASM